MFSSPLLAKIETKSKKKKKEKPRADLVGIKHPTLSPRRKRH